MVPPGIDADGVTGWLVAHVPLAQPPLTFAVIVGGRSNLTYEVTDASGRRWALRRPPLSQVLQSAHDVAREHRIIAALAATDVPVPPVVGLCEDPTVTGAPFYVMDFVDGTVLRNAGVVEEAVPEAARGRVTEDIVTALAELHAVDPESVGLSDLGRRDDYLGRQLRRWQRQLDSMGGEPLLAGVHNALTAAVPATAEGGAIVHGDFRPANTITGPDGALRAVLDWELCTLGDPLADVGWLLIYWSPPQGIALPALSMPTTAPGFGDAADVAQRYAELSGRSVLNLGYYMAFSYWKLAVILFGVRHRSRSGAYGDNAPDDSTFDGTIEGLAAAASAALAATT